MALCRPETGGFFYLLCLSPRFILFHAKGAQNLYPETARNEKH